MTDDENFEKRIQRATAARESLERKQYEDAVVNAIDQGGTKADFDAALDSAQRQIVRHINSQIIEEAEASRLTKKAHQALTEEYTRRILMDGLPDVSKPTEASGPLVDPLQEMATSPIILSQGEMAEAISAASESEIDEIEADLRVGLTTSNIAHCFAGLGYDEIRFKKQLGKKPKWLECALLQPGQRGVSERIWDPVLLGAALIKNGLVNARNVRARFQSSTYRTHLQSWLEDWKAYEAEYLSD